MTAKTKGFQISMGTAGKLLIAFVLFYAIIAAGFSIVFLRKIENDARYTQEQQLPLVMNQNRNAIKVERLASLARSIYLAKDRELERQLQLQTHVLAQSFTLDENNELAKGVMDVGASVKRIVAIREQIRRMDSGTSATMDAGMRADLEKQALETYQNAMQVTDKLSQSIINDAAVLAYGMSGDIQRTARVIQIAWIIILILPVMTAVGAIYVVAKHIVSPINSAIEGLRSIDRYETSGFKLERPLFRELSTIYEAIDAYGRVSHDLLRTNSILQALSEEDGLTTLANRRSFEKRLEEEFAKAMAGDSDLAILMVDLDHFKSINDQYGHQMGDTCLKMTANVLRSVGTERECHAARYGGEEFSVVFPGCNLQDAFAEAEKIRLSISSLIIKTTHDEVIRITASVGVASVRSAAFQGSAELLENADRALYLAKHSGRNIVKALPLSGRTDLKSVPA
ncbi:GGDEF domain-containing protein [Phyllobacterium lublinensis]|uniref:GGDEF domain-containing protein n=1 Tax=Phyllobacterium lublinensis TaxID=2875708 RepID=UPI001CCA5E34|nr:GGDEF domain-containing protein [Phyllobacterium sp. 2063]MBZ9654591.1 GGDEF domain-containing protein [Phyllobacterium sp. 2063]